MRRIIRATIVVAGAIACARSAGAQALGPQRQFLALEPYYEHLQLDAGPGADKQSRNAFGGRLWINLDPFHFIPNGSIALFSSFSPKRSYPGGSTSVLTYGGEYDQYVVRRPLGGVIDPFFSLGGAAYRLGTFTDAGGSGHVVSGALIPGGGIRIPIPNRWELRGDVKDLILFNRSRNTDGSGRRTNNLLLQAALGLTF